MSQRPQGAPSDDLRWATTDSLVVAQELGVAPDRGLSQEEAARRLAAHGPNRLEEPPGRSFARMLWDQVTEILVLILLGAAVLSAVLGEWADVAVILLIVVLNAFLGASQECRAEASLAALKRMGAPGARVVREGHLREVAAQELVPGDVIQVEAGDHVPADARILEAAALRVDESALTGESEPVEKGPAPLDATGVHGLGDLGNLLFSGTTVAYGRARAVVYATGMRTALGRIAGLLASEPAEATPLQRRMAEVGRTLGLAAGVLVAVVFIVGLLRGQPIIQMLLTAVSLAVAAIPEGLPAIVTIVLALGVQRMAERRAIVRRLPAVETLGTATVIASDKTGTLTLNRMTVTHLVTPVAEYGVSTDGTGDGPEAATGEGGGAGTATLLLAGPPADGLAADLAWLLAGAALANDARVEEEDGVWRPVGDPTETALLEAARRLGLELTELEQALPRQAELPFDSDRKRMTTFHLVGDQARVVLGDRRDLAGRGPVLAFTKGAPDLVLERCSRILRGEGTDLLDETERARILEANDRMARGALRVLAVACRSWDAVPEPLEAETAERDLILLGLVGMIDPPRAEAAASVQEARRAGIRTLMVTGDHATTAEAIARSLSLAGPGDPGALSGRELDRLDDEALRETVRRVSLFARVSPEHKLRIVRALKANGEVVAVTGDGVNDAPALKGADIGCAMGITGTDVAREAADMVLADDNYATIVSAVREGRVIYANIRKSIHYLLSCNVGEIVAIFFGIALGMGSPLTPIQILWVNLVTDGLPALALGVEPPEPGVMDRSPRNPRESVFGGGIGGLTIWQGALIGLLTLGVFAWARQMGDLARAQTLAFATLAFAQLAHSFNVRSAFGSLFRIGWFSNRPLLLAVATSGLLQCAVLVLPFLAPFFDVTGLSSREAAVIAAASVAPWVVVEGVKAVLRRRQPS
ncbi:ATPase [Limnochorda pilosa]|uniref:ATPase n=2 Tax=Limnochorda pilosa TaxID=1555112 RepID=A0A0K2SQ44_LIMPI|nr:ATPase [Limnochorda pilosa]